VCFLPTYPLFPTLSQFPQWKSTYSNTTCLSCIARGPDNTLSCRHALCDTCVIIHGRTTLEEPWNFILEICPLCNIPNKVNFVLKPYTAGTRCLSIDGGTIQDIMSLQALEKELKLPMPIREHFDIGTESDLGLWSASGLKAASNTPYRCLTCPSDLLQGMVH
jgi:hypothetical protein